MSHQGSSASWAVARPLGLSTNTSVTSVIAVSRATIALGLALPFLGQTIPYGIPLFFLVACCAFAVAVLRRSWLFGVSGVVFPFDGFVLSLLFVFALFLYGMLRSERIDPALYGELANVVSILALYSAAVNSSSLELRRVVQWSLSLIVFICAFAAALGIWKFLLLLQGRRLAFVEAGSPDGYPFGTSLINDYNMFSLALLGGALAAFARLLQVRSGVWRAGLSIALVIILAAGMFAGSRRFWLVTPLAFGLILFLVAPRIGMLRTTRRTAFLICVVLFAGLVASKYSGLDWAYVNDFIDRLEGRLSTLLDAEGGRGFEPRLMRWEYAYALAQGASAWFGQGFDYLYAYGCRFGACTSIDYPHNPFLSALLYGGLLGVASVVILLTYATIAAVRSFYAPLELAACGVIAIVHLPFVLVSGNSILSVKSFLISMVLVQLVNRVHTQGAS